MFTSATLKLTAWYLMIIVAISILFSVIIFEISTNEVSRRLERLQIRLEGSSETLVIPGPLTLSDLRADQTAQARTNIFFGLLYMNVAVVGVGGIGSYLLAKRTLRPIEEAHDAQSRFTSDASHELRTPLTVMKSEIQVALRDKAITKTELQDLLKSNLEEVDKLATLSQSLLELSRLENGVITRSEKVDVTAITKQAAAIFSEHSKRIHLDLPEKRIVADGNYSMLTDVIRILLDNAVKYSPPDSAVKVALSEDGRYCTMVIENEGEGIAAQDLPHIFERFYRGDRSRTRQAEEHGYGLGLSIAKRIVDVHEGNLTAVSSPGEKTVLTMQLPIIQKNR